MKNRPMTTPTLRRRTKSALRRSSIQPEGQDFDDGDITPARIDAARRGTTGASQNEL